MCECSKVKIELLINYVIRNNHHIMLSFILSNQRAIAKKPSLGRRSRSQEVWEAAQRPVEVNIIVTCVLVSVGRSTEQKASRVSIVL